MAEAQERLLRGQEDQLDYRALWNFLSGCLLTFAVASGAVSYLYFMDLKELLDFNQTQIETLAAVCISGVFITLPFSAVYGRYAFYGTCLAGYLVTGAGILPMGIMAALPETFSRLSFFVYFFQFVMSVGRCGLLFVTQLMTILLVPERHTGKAISSMTSMLLAGEVAGSALYLEQFSSIEKVGYYFFVTFAVITGATAVYVATYIISYACDSSRTITPPVKSEKQHVTYKSKEPRVKLDQQVEASSISNIGEAEATYGEKKNSSPMTLWELASSCKFHCFVWSGAILISAGKIFMVNIGLLLQSLQMSGHENAVVMTMLITCAVSRLVSGFVYDVLDTPTKRISLMLATSALTILAFGVLLFWMEYLLGIFISVVLCFTGLGMVFPTYISFSGILMGYQNTANVKGSLTTTVALLIFAMSLVTGTLYDKFTVQHDPPGVDRTCYGSVCYWWAFLVILVILMITPLLLIFLISAVRKENERDNCSRKI